MQQTRKTCLWTWTAVLAAVVVASAAQAAAPDWHQWRGPDRTGLSTETGWRANWSEVPPPVLWKAELGQGWSTVSVANGLAYSMGNADGKDTVWCLAVDGGEVKWQKSYACDPGNYPGPRATPTVDGDRVYTLSRNGDLFCFEAATGQIKWQLNARKEFGAKPETWGFACSPLIHGNHVVIDVGSLIALDKMTGKLAWKAGTDKAGYSSPIAFALGRGTCIASFNEHGPIVVNAANGKILGRSRWETKYGVNAVTPIVQGKTLFISSGYDAGAALYEMATTGLKTVWQNKEMRNHANNCVLWKGHLYGFDGQVDQGALTCIDYKTGQKKWSETSLRAGALMLADGKLLVMGHKGEVAAAEATPTGFKELGRLKVLEPTCWTMPVLSGGRLYCRNNKGNLVCLDVRAK